MKIMMATIPIRPTPSNFPPMGSLGILTYLKRHGIEAELYHIDGNRPSYEDALRHIVDTNPDVLGVSAVVSTSYAYTKRLVQDVKKALPGTLVIVGGPMAASGELLLRRAGADLCGLGEGERVFLDVVRRAETTHNPADFKDIPGLLLIDEQGRLINTGFAEALPAEEVYEIDWTILERATDMDLYFPDVDTTPGMPERFSLDPRYAEPHRRGKRAATIDGSKGCVARCTFCHRWDKGIRYIPVPVLERRIKHLIDTYNVGYIIFGDENFGTNKKWLADLCKVLKENDILWRVAGMRVNCVNPEIIALMRDSGCVSILYGMETGSERILQVMEKKVKLQDNYNAMQWTYEAGVDTVVQLVIGMPGESPETIAETTQFCKWTQAFSPEQNPNDLSINYAQALPGSPLYEYALHKGLVKPGLDGEEEYLLKVSDREASDASRTTNFTAYPFLLCQTWRSRMTAEINYAYVRKYGIEHYRMKMLTDGKYLKKPEPDSGYFNAPKVDTSAVVIAARASAGAAADKGGVPKMPPLMGLLRKRQFGLALICYPVLAYRLRALMILLVIMKDLKDLGTKATLRLIGEYLSHLGGRVLDRAREIKEYKSLRKIVVDDLGKVPTDSDAMVPLRRGR
jgi:radical SAM superfamily enzyme YgiQ (UPF0313 family)